MITLSKIELKKIMQLVVNYYHNNYPLLHPITQVNEENGKIHCIFGSGYTKQGIQTFEKITYDITGIDGHIL